MMEEEELYHSGGKKYNLNPLCVSNKPAPYHQRSEEEQRIVKRLPLKKTRSICWCWWRGKHHHQHLKCLIILLRRASRSFCALNLCASRTMADGCRVNDEESLRSTDANDAARRPRRDLSKPSRTIARKRDATTASVETVSTQWIVIIDIPSYASVTNVR